MKFLDNFINIDNAEEEIYAIIRTIRPEWKRKDIRIKHFGEGYINVMLCYYHYSDAAMDAGVVVRVFGAIGDGVGQRHLEFMHMQLAHAAGVFSKIVATFSNGIVYMHAPGRTLRAVDFCNPTIIRPVARALSQLNHLDIKSVPLVDIKGNNVDYPLEFKQYDILRKHIEQIPESLQDPVKNEWYQRVRTQKDVLKDELAMTEKLMSELHLPTGLGHADFHVKNVVYDENTGKCCILDYEFSGISYELHDICCLDRTRLIYDIFGVTDKNDPVIGPEGQRLWLRHYWERKYELDGRCASDVTEKDVDRLVIESELTFLLRILVEHILGYALLNVPDTKLDDGILPFIELTRRLYYEAKESFPNYKAKLHELLDFKQ